VVRAVRDRPGAASRPAAPRVTPPTPYVRRHDGGSRPLGVVTPAGTAPEAGPTLRPVVDPSVQRAVIGTAAEVLMSRHDCGVDAAYATILERARDTGTSTYEVAVRVVEEGGLVEEG
jgi:ANTAR domain